MSTPKTPEQRFIEALFPIEHVEDPRCPWSITDFPGLHSYEVEALNDHQLMLEEIYPEEDPQVLKDKVLYTLVNIQEIADLEVPSWPHEYSYALASRTARTHMRMSHPQFGPLITCLLGKAKVLQYKNLDQEV